MKSDDVITSRCNMRPFYDLANKVMATSRSLKEIFEWPSLHQIRNKNEKVFIYEVDGKEVSLKYKDYHQSVMKYAKAISLMLNDIKPDTFVGFKVNNSIKWPLAFWGLVAAGYKPLLINPILSKEDTNKLLKEANASAIISEDKNEYCVSSFTLKTLEIKDANNYEPLWANELAFCTSGTTGDSRIFIYDGNALAHQIYAAFCMPFTSADIMYIGRVRLLALIPFSHIFGFVAVLLWYTFFGATIVFPKSNTPEDLQYAIKTYKCSHIYAVPLFWDTITNKFKHAVSLESEKKQALIKKVIDYKNGYITKSEAGIASHKFVLKAIQKKVLGPQIVFCIAGGSALSKDTLETMNGIGYNLYNGYGMTEIGVTSVELSPKVEQRNKGSVGKALTGVDYKLVNNELLVKSPYLHIGRFADGKRLSSDVDEEGYFHTGDIASIDKDGYVFIKGKTKEVIIGSNGENIYPEEIEIKFKALPHAANLSVIGVKTNKEEILTLILNVNNTLNKEQIKELENQIKNINDSLPIAMQVKDYYLALEPIPMNASLKVKRYQLINDFTNKPQSFIKLSSGVNVSFEGFDEEKVKTIVDKLTDIVADNLYIEKEKIAPNNHLIIDLGGDSFSYMSLIAAIETEFKIQIPSSMIGKLNSINEFALYILKNTK